MTIKNNAEDQDIKMENGRAVNGGGTSRENEKHVNASESEEEKHDNSSETAAKEAEEWKDKYLRLQAEFDNYRKRTLKEKMDLVSFGGEDVIKALLPVLDDTDRALDAMAKTEDIDSIRTGIELVSKKLHDALTSKGLCEIDAVGCDLDTDLHDAVAKIPVDKKQRGKIVDVVQKGYKLKDKVVRHAKCVVGE